MPRNFELLVFDWDGTLIDSAGHIVASLQAACRDLGLPLPTEQACRHIIGLGLHDAIRHVLPDVPESRFPDVARRYSFHYLSGEEGVRLFPMVKEGLAALEDSGHMLAVATGKSRKGLDRILSAMDLQQHFVATRCADEGFPKPHPDMLEKLMDMLGVAPERTLMIGDTTHDLQMAASARTPAIAVTYGAHAPEALSAHSPLACVNSFPELLQWLRSHA
jgi:phosphoglycolate phosphatase